MVAAAEWEAIFASIGFWIVAFQPQRFKDDLILQIFDVQGKLLAMSVDLYWDGHTLLVDVSERVAIDSGEVVRSYCQSGFRHMHPSPHSGSLRYHCHSEHVAIDQGMFHISFLHSEAKRKGSVECVPTNMVEACDLCYTYASKLQHV